MNIASFGAPFAGGLAGTRGLLRGTSLHSMVRTVGTIAGAISLAAGYQILYEEGRGFISRMREGAATRTQNNTALMLLLLNKGLPTPVLRQLQKSRDRVATATDIVIMEDATVTEEHRATIATVLGRLVGQPA